MKPSNNIAQKFQASVANMSAHSCQCLSLETLAKLVSWFHGFMVSWFHGPPSAQTSCTHQVPISTGSLVEIMALSRPLLIVTIGRDSREIGEARL